MYRSVNIWRVGWYQSVTRNLFLKRGFLLFVWQNMFIKLYIISYGIVFSSISFISNFVTKNNWKHSGWSSNETDEFAHICCFVKKTWACLKTYQCEHRQSFSSMTENNHYFSNSCPCKSFKFTLCMNFRAKWILCNFLDDLFSAISYCAWISILQLN